MKTRRHQGRPRHPVGQLVQLAEGGGGRLPSGLLLPPGLAPGQALGTPLVVQQGGQLGRLAAAQVDPADLAPRANRPRVTAVTIPGQLDYPLTDAPPTSPADSSMVHSGPSPETCR